jgi:hypothetical protein
MWTGVVMEDNGSFGHTSLPFCFDGGLKFVFEKITVVGCIHLVFSLTKRLHKQVLGSLLWQGALYAACLMHVHGHL